MSLEDVIIHIRIEEQNKAREKVERVKELSSKANLVEERPRPKFNRPKRQNLRTKPNSSNKVQILPLKIEVALFMASLDTMYLSVAIERDSRESTYGQIW